VTAAALTVQIGIPENRLYEMINEQRGMIPPCAWRILRSRPQFMNESYEPDAAQQKTGDN
jgi:hypothetical protein